MRPRSAFYTYRVRWSEEDEEFVATVAEFPSLSWLDEDQSFAFDGIVKLVAEVIEDLEANDEPVPEPYSLRSFSGNVRLRMPPEQHRELSIQAAEEGVSLNRLLCSLISRPVVASYSVKERGDTDEKNVLQNGVASSESNSKTARIKLSEPNHMGWSFVSDVSGGKASTAFEYDMLKEM